MGKAGDILVNRRRREKVVLVETGDENGGRRLVMAVTQEPTPARMPVHCHPQQTETFTIGSGRLTYTCGNSSPRTAAAGESLIIPAGVSHSWWNEGPETLELVGTLEPAGHWLEFMETIYGLTADGKVDANGIPNRFQLAVIAWHYRHEWIPTAIPIPVRAIVIPVLALIGRIFGYRPRYIRSVTNAEIAPAL